MPRSTPIFKAETAAFLKSEFKKSAKILDVGAGVGTYADLLRDHFMTIDAVEVFEPYIEQFGLKEKYNKVFNFDIKYFKRYPEILPGWYDIIILGDVLEHISKEEGIYLIKELQPYCQEMIVCVPFMSEQGEHYDNKYEIHLQPDLNEEVMAERYPDLQPFCLRYDFGVYIKKSPKNKFVEIIYDELYNGKKVKYPSEVSDITIVSGLWDLGRQGRSFDHYLVCFNQFLDIDCRMVLFIPKDLEELVWEKRSKENTFVKIYELDDIRKLYDPHWDMTQKIRTDPDWFNLAGWLPDSPQASLEWYNPVVQSKMFMLHEASIWSPFNTEKLVWLDAGITNTVDWSLIRQASTWKMIEAHIDPWLFLSYPYDAEKEIHGFKYEWMNKYAEADVKYVCRGGLFGGTRDVIREANGIYYSLLNGSLSQGLMGTEESLFTIMSYQMPDTFRRYELDGNGLIIKFIQDLHANKQVKISSSDYKMRMLTEAKFDRTKTKTDLYFLTFNFPKQIERTLQTYKDLGWLDYANKVWVFDNSVTEEPRVAIGEVCKKFGCNHVITGSNLGINPGRQRVAEHFNTTDADYYMFFEDDMTIGSEADEGKFCRRGLRKFVVNLWDSLHKIMIKEEFDYLKLNFTEVYMDNYLQVSWFNVPDSRRAELWPTFNKRRSDGGDYKDLRFPRTVLTKIDELTKIDDVSGLLYASGQIYYCNWPMIMSKAGNRKVFLDTTWAAPFEQTWMSHVFEEQLKGNIRAGVLLASPITHDRFEHYSAEDRREN